jgi:hypothetical protein
MLLKDELQSFISGTGQVTKGTAIQTISNYIRKSNVAGGNTETEWRIKE